MNLIHSSDDELTETGKSGFNFFSFIFLFFVHFYAFYVHFYAFHVDFYV